ncbi:hypothetical protein MFRU_009g02870 [Monilinia fructicola]|nr:hypothetical protein MFRU_009g02870 [Monilinia fructicola]
MASRYRGGKVGMREATSPGTMITSTSSLKPQPKSFKESPESSRPLPQDSKHESPSQKQPRKRKRKTRFRRTTPKHPSDQATKQPRPRNFTKSPPPPRKCTGQPAHASQSVSTGSSSTM